MRTRYVRKRVVAECALTAAANPTYPQLWMYMSLTRKPIRELFTVVPAIGRSVGAS